MSFPFRISGAMSSFIILRPYTSSDMAEVEHLTILNKFCLSHRSWKQPQEQMSLIRRCIWSSASIYAYICAFSSATATMSLWLPILELSYMPTSIGFNHLHALTPQKQEDRWVRFSATFVQWDGACVRAHAWTINQSTTHYAVHAYACIDRSIIWPLMIASSLALLDQYH
jgi:hypothetical protein